MSEYQWKSGTADWNGDRVSVFVVADLPREGDRDVVRDFVSNRILAENPDLAAGHWVVIGKYPPSSPQEWKIIGAGVGTRVLPEIVNAPIPDDVLPRLHEVFGS